MNNTKIEWTDFTWNPYTGCLRNCEWCYAKRIYHRFGRSFEPQFHPEKLGEPISLKKASKIFTCSVADFFANWTKPEWIRAILRVIKQCPHHIFQVLTQDPQNIDSIYNLPLNLWVGTTIRNQKETTRIDFLRNSNAKVKFISFEPLMGAVDTDLMGIDWVIVGAMTGHLRRKYEPHREWITKLIDQTREMNIPIFIKDNIHWDEEIKEFPK